MKCPDTNCTVSADLPTPPEPNTTTLNSFMIDLLELVRVLLCLIYHHQLEELIITLFSLTVPPVIYLDLPQLPVLSRLEHQVRLDLPGIKQFIIQRNSGNL